MAGNRLLTATVVLAALLALTVWKFNDREMEDKRAPEVSVKLPKLKKGDIDELQISAPNKPAVVLKKTDKSWSLVEPIKAPAEQASVDAALAKLDELEVVGVAATKPENYDKLEVDDKKSLHVIARQGGKALADLRLGAYRGGNTMVREQGAANVASVKGSIKFAFEKDVKDWRDKVIVEASADHVKSVAYENKNGTFRFVKDGSAWKQAAGEKPLPNFDPGKVVSLVGTATSLRAQDFAGPEVTADAAGVGAKPDGKVTVGLGGDAGEQEIVVYSGHKRSEGYYLKRADKETIFIVSDFAGERTQPGADKFAKDKPPEAQPGAKAAAAPERHLGGGPGMAEAMKAHQEVGKPKK
jgi:hypothetical protein